MISKLHTHLETQPQGGCKITARILHHRNYQQKEKNPTLFASNFITLFEIYLHNIVSKKRRFKWTDLSEESFSLHLFQTSVVAKQADLWSL